MDSALRQIGGHGPTVVLMHGFGADHFTWLTTTPSLLKTASVWAIDLPGHGKGERDCGDGSLYTLADRVETYLNKANLSDVHLVGHSLGARVSMELACRAPNRIQSLFLVSPAGVGGCINSDFLTGFYQADTEESITLLLRMLVYDPRMISRSLAGKVLDFLEQDGTRDNLERIANGLSAAQVNIDSTLSRLRETNIPCRSIWGLQDQINPHGKTATDQLLPGDRHLLSDCGHLPHLEHSTAVNRLLADFHRSLA